jgi:hypothetical protein
MRFFLGFFGITRSLRYTAHGIARNIVAPLRRAGLPPRCFGHFHRPPRIDNPRSREAGCAVDPTEAKLLGCEALMQEKQEPALIENEYAFCASFPDHFQDGYASVRNLCFQLRSLRQLWGLMAEHVTEADWVLFLRPDLDYLDPLDPRAAIARLEAAGCDWGVPRWHGWGGLNDRMALCRGDAAADYATRGAAIYEAAAALNGLHGESLLAYAARRRGIRVGEFAMRAVRVRADGRPAPQDVQEFFAADYPVPLTSLADCAGDGRPLQRMSEAGSLGVSRHDQMVSPSGRSANGSVSGSAGAPSAARASVSADESNASSNAPRASASTAADQSA